MKNIILIITLVIFTISLKAQGEGKTYGIRNHATVAEMNAINPSLLYGGEVAKVGDTLYLYSQAQGLWLNITAGGGGVPDDWGNDVVNTDGTLLGDGTLGNPVKGDTTILATKNDIKDSLSLINASQGVEKDGYNFKLGKAVGSTVINPLIENREVNLNGNRLYMGNSGHLMLAPSYRTPISNSRLVVEQNGSGTEYSASFTNNNGSGNNIYANGNSSGYMAYLDNYSVNGKALYMKSIGGVSIPTFTLDRGNITASGLSMRGLFRLSHTIGITPLNGSGTYDSYTVNGSIRAYSKFQLDDATNNLWKFVFSPANTGGTPIDAFEITNVFGDNPRARVLGDISINNVIIDGAGNKPTSENQVLKPDIVNDRLVWGTATAQIVSIDDYGAIAGDPTKGAENKQAVLDMIIDKGFVVVGEGNYYCDGDIDIANASFITSYGAGKITFLNGIDGLVCDCTTSSKTYINIENISFSGTLTGSAIKLNACYTSIFRNIRTESLTALNGLDITQMWGSNFDGIYFNGSSFTNAAMLLDTDINANTFNNIYTSNDAQYQIKLEGTGRNNVFNNTTIQGGNYGIHITGSFRGNQFNSVYTENNAINLYLGSGSTTSPNADGTSPVLSHEFNDFTFSGAYPSNPHYVNSYTFIDLNNAKNCTFNDPYFIDGAADTIFVINKVDNIQINNPSFACSGGCTDEQKDLRRHIYRRPTSYLTAGININQENPYDLTPLSISDNGDNWIARKNNSNEISEFNYNALGSPYPSGELAFTSEHESVSTIGTGTNLTYSKYGGSATIPSSFDDAEHFWVENNSSIQNTITVTATAGYEFTNGSYLGGLTTIDLIPGEVVELVKDVSTSTYRIASRWKGQEIDFTPIEATPGQTVINVGKFKDYDFNLFDLFIDGKKSTIGLTNSKIQSYDGNAGTITVSPLIGGEHIYFKGLIR